jgi:hypothetical protein
MLNQFHRVCECPIWLAEPVIMLWLSRVRQIRIAAYTAPSTRIGAK